jgi:glycosyltransferase involved in cell wall biosynthesis
MHNKTILVAIPCLNEEMTIKKVIDDFTRELPDAKILIIDNNSSDQTADRAAQSGAEVIAEKKQGKGFAIQRIFEECKADILLLVDGDDTYLSSEAKKLIDPIIKGEAEMVVGDRIHGENTKNFSNSHWLGNKFLTKALNFIFRTKLNDMESGYRAIDRKFVESSALLAGGFGIEPELTIQAIEKGFRIKEVPISVKPREKGSHSKLNTFRDGTIVIYTMISLFRDYKPLHFFALLSAISFLLAFGLGWYSVKDYLHTGIVYHIPSLIVAGLIAISGLMNLIAGLILSSIKRRHEELVILMNRNIKRR